ncbi:MAG: lasso peptide biosynthesis B2 protein [bacterium]
MLSKLHSRGYRVLLLIEALICLGVMRVAILTVPFRKIVAHYHLVQGETVIVPAGRKAARAESIGWAVRAAAARTPWQSACLVQSLAAMLMLRRRGIPGTLYLGVAKNEDNPAEPIAAHSWLRCGKRTLTGYFADNRYTVIAKFSW